MVELLSPQYYKLALQYSSLAFLYFDYTLTFSKEVKYFWSKPWRITALLYFCCRYAMLANLLYLLAITDVLHKCVHSFPSAPRYELRSCFSTSCNLWYQVIAAISILGRIGLMTILTMRTYVVWGQNKFVLIGLGVMEAACVGLSCAKVPQSMCWGKAPFSSFAVSASLSVLALLFDFLVAVLTLVRTHLALRKWKNNGVGYRNTIMYFIWEQGILYFIAVFGLQLAAMIVPMVAAGSIFQRIFAAYTLPLSCLLAARFLLDLQAWGETQQKEIEGSSVFSTCNLTFMSSLEDGHQQASSKAFGDFGSDPVGWSPVRTPVARSALSTMTGGFDIVEEERY